MVRLCAAKRSILTPQHSGDFLTVMENYAIFWDSPITDFHQGHSTKQPRGEASLQLLTTSSFLKQTVLP